MNKFRITVVRKMVSALMYTCYVQRNVYTRDIGADQQAISRSQRILLFMNIIEFIPTLTVLSIAPDFVRPHQAEISETAVNIKENFPYP